MRAGKSKGSTISQYGFSTFGALATEALQEGQEAWIHLLQDADQCWVIINIAVKFSVACMSVRL
jgi:hypothetical protein